MEQEIYWIWLSRLPRIQVRQVKELGKVYENLEALWQEKNEKDLAKSSTDWRKISQGRFI